MAKTEAECKYAICNIDDLGWYGSVDAAVEDLGLKPEELKDFLVIKHNLDTNKPSIGRLIPPPKSIYKVQWEK